MDLFESASERLIAQTAPLADRMRPQNLEHYIGQEKIIGKGRLLRRAIEADQLTSVIFYGPPGTGKTTLARIIAKSTQAHFITINAVLAGVKDIRESIATAKDCFTFHSQKTILFVDEVHRFNKAQQDALLPHVENGTITLIGATTENPYFEVNKALVSRSRIFELHLLSVDELGLIIDQVLSDPSRGYGSLQVHISPKAREHLCATANGDARSLLNALELAVETTESNTAGIITISREIAEESIQKRAVLYDKDGDSHYDIISAFIKSIRGSDPDAALFWLAKMLYAGEDPRFIFRRMIISATEDIGLADPQALPVVMAAAQAYDYIGMPEGRFPLSQACLYLATAPKSNTTLALFDALASIEQSSKEEAVPNPLKDSSRDKEGLGHGEGYLYPHAYRDHWVEQQYLPNELQGKVFYTPTNQGYESTLKERVESRRDLQITALNDISEQSTFSWKGGSNGAWKERASGSNAHYYDAVRSDFFTLADIPPHGLVLDLSCGDGINTFEALRRASIGGVWSVIDESKRSLIEHRSEALPLLARPQLISRPLSQALCNIDMELRFTHVLGRNCLTEILGLPKAVIHEVGGGEAAIILSQYDQFKSTKLSSFLSDSNLRRVLEKAEIAFGPSETISNQIVALAEIFEESHHCQVLKRSYTIERTLSIEQLSVGLGAETSLGSSCGVHREEILEELYRSLSIQTSQWEQVVHFVKITPKKQ